MITVQPLTAKNLDAFLEEASQRFGQRSPVGYVVKNGSVHAYPNAFFYGIESIQRGYLYAAKFIERETECVDEEQVFYLHVESGTQYAFIKENGLYLLHAAPGRETKELFMFADTARQ